MFTQRREILPRCVVPEDSLRMQRLREPHKVCEVIGIPLRLQGFSPDQLLGYFSLVCFFFFFLNPDPLIRHYFF